VAAFAAGVAVGLAWRRDPGPSIEDVAALASRGTVFDGLGLTPAQRAAVDSILDAFESWSDSVLSTPDSALTSHANRAQAAIRAVLDPRQDSLYMQRLDSVGAVVRVRRIRVPAGGGAGG
jgi:hypothetical protein